MTKSPRFRDSNLIPVVIVWPMPCKMEGKSPKWFFLISGGLPSKGGDVKLRQNRTPPLRSPPLLKNSRWQRAGRGGSLKSLTRALRCHLPLRHTLFWSTDPQVSDSGKSSLPHTSHCHTVTPSDLGVLRSVPTKPSKRAVSESLTASAPSSMEATILELGNSLAYHISASVQVM